MAREARSAQRCEPTSPRGDGVGPASAGRLTRRRLLTAGAASAAALAVNRWDSNELIGRALAASPRPGATLRDIEHVVILIQENRSFDHYFGTTYGVRGFSDPAAHRDPTGRSVFDQPDPDLIDNPNGRLLPWHLDTTATSAQCLTDITHAWSAQHYSWNEGLMNGFMGAHRVGDGNGRSASPGTMGYYRRADLPFHYALADAFTICDAYFCSVFGPTNPNRIMSMSATIDPDGSRGGPCIDNSQSTGQLHWTAYPELLQSAGISWFVYQEADNDTNNVLPLFAAFQDPKSDLYRRANTVIPTPRGAPYGPALAARLKTDVLGGRLPQVSWILASTADCEHPDSAPASGARFVSSVLDALTADPHVWARTVLFYTFDENGGFFDHVVPPTPPPGTAGEYLSPTAAATVASSTLGQLGPVGLGFRVPMIVVSPFSAGGLVCTDTFDHTSLLRFLERRFGVPVPNLSAWRRSVAGDLTSALNLAAKPTQGVPPLPNALALERAATARCRSAPAPQPPVNQSVPAQEKGTRARPSGAGTDSSPRPPSNRRSRAVQVERRRSQPRRARAAR